MLAMTLAPGGTPAYRSSARPLGCTDVDRLHAGCHGYCGLLNVTLTNGAHLVAGRNLTGFSWTEEVLARVDKLVPYNVEQQVKDRGALYHKAKLPFVPHVITDGRLITGQNPASAKDTAQAVAAALSR